MLDFVRDRVTPVAEWVTWTGGDPELVILVIAETPRSIADGLEGETGDDSNIPAPPTSSVTDQLSGPIPDWLDREQDAP